MESVYLNGGFIGPTVSFGDTERYILDIVENFPTVEGIATSNTGSGTSHTLSLPSNIQADDLLISIVTNDGNNDNVSFPSGWEQIAIINSPNSRSMGITIFKRIADGNEPSTITITTPSTEATAHVTYRISGATGEVALSDWAQQATSTASNQPQLTAPWGSKKNLWITALGVETPRDATGYPANYVSGTQSVNSIGSGGGAGTYSAHRLLETETENPGSITFSASWTGGAAITMVVEPKDDITFGNQKNSGIWLLQSVYDSIINIDEQINYRYYRWVITAIRGGGSDSLVQASEFVFQLDNSDIVMSGATVTNIAGSSPSAEQPPNLIDGNTSTKWLNLSGISGQGVQFDFGSQINVDGYRWATANDAIHRDPISWDIQGSNDEINWTILDTRTSETITTSRFTYIGPYQLGNI
jgi:hypothetical protein